MPEIHVTLLGRFAVTVAESRPGCRTGLADQGFL